MIGDSIGAAVGANRRLQQAKKETRAAKSDRERALAMAAEANYNPFLVSDIIDPYQRSQSPVARGYLESFLTGANPQAVQGVRAGARPQQAAAQQGCNQAYGGWDELRAKQRAMEQSTPWDIKPFKEAPVSEEMRWNAKLGQGGRIAMNKYGLDYDDLATLERLGITVDGRKGDLDGMNRDTDKEVQSINRLAKGDGNKGLLERYLSQVRSGSADTDSARQIIRDNRANKRDEALAQTRRAMGYR